MARAAEWIPVALTIVGGALAVIAITEIHKISKELRKLRGVLEKLRGSG